MANKTLTILAFLILISVLISYQNYEQFTGHITESYTDDTITETYPNDTLGTKDYNIILIIIDTLRADHLGVYGYERDTSPNIDDFAEDSFVFEHAYTPRPKTSPAIASMLTGNYEHTHGVVRIKDFLNPNNLMISEILKDSGFRTGAVVSNKVVGSEFGFDQGFDNFYGVMDNGDNVTNFSISWLENNSDEKFFLWIHYLKPHTMYKPDSPYNEMFINDMYYGFEKIKFNAGKFDCIGGAPNHSILDNNDNLYYYISQYDGEIRNVDYEIGRLLKTIEDLELLENSIIILTADHGEGMGEHNQYFEHGLFPYDTCTRIPMIIRIPGIAPETVETPVSLIDMTPTILDLLDIENTSVIEGHSLIPLLTEGQYPKYVYTVSGYTEEPQISVRKGNWKLIYIPSEFDRSLMNNVTYEFYDTRQDPEELVNLADRNLPVYHELKAEIERRVSVFGDYYLQRNPSEETTINLTDNTLELLKTLGYIS